MRLFNFSIELWSESTDQARLADFGLYGAAKFSHEMHVELINVQVTDAGVVSLSMFRQGTSFVLKLYTFLCSSNRWKKGAAGLTNVKLLADATSKFVNNETVFTKIIVIEFFTHFTIFMLPFLNGRPEALT